MRSQEHVSDAELIAAARAGSVVAFEELIDRHYEAVMRYLWRLTGDRDWMRDLTQETFLDAYRARESLPENRPFERWLMVIARNNYLTENRRRRLIQFVSIHRLVSLFGQRLRGFAVDDESEAFAERSQLEQAMLMLSPTLREPVVMLSLGYEMEEIAELLELEHATARQRVSRGLRRLREIYTKLETGGGDR